jgi:hypothetical protein
MPMPDIIGPLAEEYIKLMEEKREQLEHNKDCNDGCQKTGKSMLDELEED